MLIVFIFLSFVLYIITIYAWRKKSYPVELKSHLIMLALGFVAFNTILVLISIFDYIEVNTNDNKVPDVWMVTMLVCCISNVIFYGIFTVLFMTNPIKRNKLA
jgi:hypothetical protein